MDGLGRGCLPEGVLDTHLAEAESRATANWTATAESALAWYAWANEQLLALVPSESASGSSVAQAVDKPDSVRARARGSLSPPRLASHAPARARR